MIGRTYRRKSDNTLWRHTATHAAAMFPVELTGTRGTVGTRLISKAEFYDKYEEVDQ